MKIFNQIRFKNNLGNLAFNKLNNKTLIKQNFFLFSIFIKTQNTPNPHFLKFLPGKELCSEGETFDFSSLKEATISPLARRIFEVNFKNTLKYFN